MINYKISLKDKLKVGAKITNDGGFIETICRVESFPFFGLNYIETTGFIGGGLKLYKTFVIDDKGKGILIKKGFQDNFHPQRYTGLSKMERYN